MKQASLYLSLLISLLVSVSAFSQTFLWAKQPDYVGNPPQQSDGEAYAVATDNAGNVYETGFFAYSNMYYGATELSTINGDAFLAKYNSAGVPLWARQATLQNIYSDCEANFVATDIYGNVYITGFFTDTVSFGAYMLATGTGGEVFLVKYDANGNVKWAEQSHETGFNGNYNMGMGVSTDRMGNIYITGQFENTTTFGAFSLSNPTGAGNQYGIKGNVFLVKYDSSGNVLWAKQAVIPSNTCFATARAVTCDAFNNVFVTGAFHDTIAFGAQTLITSSIVGEIFIAKYDEDGNALWARQSVNHSTNFWSNGPVFGNALAADKAGGVYIAGNFEDTIYFNSTELISPINFSEYAFPYGDMFLAKYDSGGNLAWAQAAYPLVNGTNAGWGVATDTLNHVYFTGGGWNVYSGTQLNFSIKFGDDTFTATAPSIESSLLLELDTGGNVLCGSIIPAGGDDNSGVASDPTGKYVYAGSDFILQNQIVIGPDTLVSDGNPLNNGVEIPFIVRWQSCAPTILPLTVSVTDSNVTCYGLCNGSATAIPSGGIPPYTYLWNTNPADSSAIITALCADSFHVIVTDSLGDTATATVTITQPAAILSVISAIQDTVCAGDTATLTVTGSGGNIQWQWAVADSDFANIPGADSATYSNAIQQTTGFRVIKNNNICYDTSPPYIIKAIAVPVPPLMAADTLICSGDSTLICTSGSYTGYIWNTGAIDSCIEAKNAGEYRVTVTGGYDCTVVSNNLYLSVYPVPPVSIEANGDSLTSLNALTYQWYFNDSLIPNANDSVYVARKTGYYAVQVTDTNGCKEISTNSLIIVSGINGISENAALNIYPNPFTNTIFIQSKTAASLINCIEIYDMTGRIIIDKNFSNAPLIGMELDVKILAEGLYYLRVKTNDGDYSQKLVKQ